MIKLMELLREATGKPKALILAGAPGAGKGYVLRKLNLGNIKVLNIDNAFIDLLKKANVTLDLKNATPEERSASAKTMAAASKELKTDILPQAIANGESFVLDGTAASFKNTITLKKELEEAGYEVFMLYVYTDLERSLKQNQDRFERSGGEDRSLSPYIVLNAWNSVTRNFSPYKNEFGDNFVSVANTGEAMKDVNQIISKYLVPFKPKDTKPKTPKQIERSRQQKAKLHKEIQDWLSSTKVQDIIDSSVAGEEAANIINQFLS